MQDQESHLNGLDPELARRIHESASRAGLQTHDPAARMITEMWVAVAAMRQERHQLSSEIDDLTQRVRDNHRYLLALVIIGIVNFLLVLALLMV